MAGALYLVNILGGAFAIGFVPSVIVAPSVAGTAHNIENHELLYRAGVTTHLLVTLTNVPLALIFYELFRSVNRRIALLDVSFILVATAIEAAGLVNEFTSILLLTGDRYIGLTAAPRDVLASLPLDVSSVDYCIHTVFFAGDILCMAYLVYKSAFMPKVIGILLAIDGVSYLIYGFADLLVPGFAHSLVPAIQLPAALG